MESRTKTRHRMYWITLFFITLSGFGQMPIFKRYYIADIPGLGWLAQFYVTHVIHYIAAAVLIALVVFLLFDFLLNGSGSKKMTRSGIFKVVLLIGLMASGGAMVFKNLPNVYFNHSLIIALDIVHLSLCMMLLIAGLYSLVRKKHWMS